MAETLLNETKDETIRDTLGRSIVMRPLDFKGRHRLFKVVGRAAQGNEAFLADCMMFASVVSIDGTPVPPPTERSDVEPIIDALGEAGGNAVQDWFANRASAENEVVTTAKN